VRRKRTEYNAVLGTALAILATAACAPLPSREARPAKSSLGCMNAALREHFPGGLDERTQTMNDAQMHCAAAGLIARYCSVTEATIASYGKELKDLVGAGDAQWRDLESDRRGIRCARSAPDTAGLLQCCLETPSLKRR
jgi:hypothetical protein